MRLWVGNEAEAPFCGDVFLFVEDYSPSDFDSLVECLEKHRICRVYFGAGNKPINPSHVEDFYSRRPLGVTCVKAEIFAEDLGSVQEKEVYWIVSMPSDLVTAVKLVGEHYITFMYPHDKYEHRVAMLPLCDGPLDGDEVIG